MLREECAWHFRDTYVRPTEDEMVEASREGVRIAIARGVTAVHDKDGWLGALGVWQRLRDEGSLHLRDLAVASRPSRWTSSPTCTSGAASATTSCASAT